MSGRFFAVPVFCAVINICAAPPKISKVIWAPVLLLSFFVGLQSPQSPVFSGKDYKNRAVLHNGIADERGWYYPCTGYLIALKRKNMPTCGWAWEGRGLRKESIGRHVMVEGFVGLVAFYAGPKVHFIDYHALTDPFLSRINIVNPKYWRIGHFIRNIPAGYEETIKTGKNVIADKRLAEYYDRLSFLIKGDLFARGRVKEIFRMNSGAYDHLLSRYRAGLVRLDVVDMENEKQEGTRWDKTGNFLFSKQGVHINFKKMIHTDEIEVSLRHNREYGILYFNGIFDVSGREIQVLEPQKSAKGGLARYNINVPSRIAKKGYTSIRIVPQNTTKRDARGSYSIGHVKLLKVDGGTARENTIAKDQ